MLNLFSHPPVSHYLTWLIQVYKPLNHSPSNDVKYALAAPLLLAKIVLFIDDYQGYVKFMEKS